MSLLLFNSVIETIEEKFHCKIQDFYSADDREASEEAHGAPDSRQNVLPLGLLILIHITSSVSDTNLGFENETYLGDNVKCRGVKIYSDMFKFCSEFVICESVNRN